MRFTTDVSAELTDFVEPKDNQILGFLPCKTGITLLQLSSRPTSPTVIAQSLNSARQFPKLRHYYEYFIRGFVSTLKVTRLLAPQTSLLGFLTFL